LQPCLTRRPNARALPVSPHPLAAAAMSSKYQSQALVIPEGFPALLKGFAREVLRVQVRGPRPGGPGDAHSSLLR
jgi:hypothetical protein